MDSIDKVCTIIPVRRCCTGKRKVDQAPVVVASSSSRNISSNERSSTAIFNAPPLTLDNELERMFVGGIRSEGRNILELNKTDKDLLSTFSAPVSNVESMLAVGASMRRRNDREEEEDHAWRPRGAVEPPPPPPPPPPPVGPRFRQTTSQHPDPNRLISDCMLNNMGMGIRPDRTAPQPGNLGHDPRGLRLGFNGSTVVTDEQWAASAWDGVPFENGKWRQKPIIPFDDSPAGKAAKKARWKEVFAWLVPFGNNLKPVIRGVHDLYYSRNPPPFLDKFNPTPDEIDDWGIVVVNHIRAMLGEPVRARNDARLFLEAKWADEMKQTNIWDAKYGDQCPPGSTGHCGAAFTPDAADRAIEIARPPYNSDFVKYPELKNYTTQRISAAEQVGGMGTQIPWSLRLGTVMVNYILGEGWLGHAGPFLGRTMFGGSYTCGYGGQAQNGGIGLRSKWAG